MATDPRRQRLALGVLLAVLAVAVWWQLGPTPPPAGGRSAAAARPSPGASRVASPDEILSTGVGLDRLARVPPAPGDGGRDPFAPGRSGVAGRGGSGGAGNVGAAPVPQLPVQPVAPTGPPPPPPIAVKFIGTLSRSDVGRMAILSDGRNVYYGREGDVVDGRWRIVQIGEESLQIEYVDGRGRQTVRLSG
jgi:hypothetical protein